MNCPNCRVPLTIAERQGVEIDFCPQCRGVWLDRGELDKIIERASPPAPSAPQTGGERYREDRSHGDRPYKKKREGFLGELFDF